MSWGSGEEKGVRTAPQQKSPQQVSPAVQNVLAQQVEPVGMQNWPREAEDARQHSSVWGDVSALLFCLLL